MDQKVRQLLRLESFDVFYNITSISAPILWGSDPHHINAQLLPFALWHPSLVFVKRSRFKETPAEESAEIADETQINQMHDIKWHGNRKMYCIKEYKRRDSLDTSSN